ncbi:ABC transporter substrate-binding protein [Microbacterium sp. CJ88]|uniref:ABC transporter substrate-binding protein n=1 Tax=Microbacterium sp. CJ88 TaxID=3445672 RepID=UPI003F65FD3C
MPLPTTRTLIGLAIGTVALATVLTGCTPPAVDTSSGGATPDAGVTSAIPDTASIVDAVSTDAALAALVPAAITSDGVLTVGSYVQSPPNNFYAADGTTVVGSDHDLITAIAKKLGLKTAYENLDFQALITSLQSGRVEVTIAAMNDTPARQQTIDFVDYLTSGITIMVQKGNPAKIGGPADLCGKKIAVVTGTSQQDFAQRTSDECVAGGKAALEITVTDSDSQNQTQLRTGRIDAIVNDLPTAVYVSKTTKNGEAFEVVPGDVIDGAPYGIGVNKSNSGLRDAVAGALDALIADGTYAKLLDAWGVQSGAVSAAAVNGGA